jgi:hypothetical protein
MPAPDEPFQMRRLKALSNTIFGVVMILLAWATRRTPLGGIQTPISPTRSGTLLTCV